MAQGSAIKKPSAPKASSKTGSTRKAQPQQPKKGARVIKPKASKGSKASADKMRRKLNAGVTARTEKILGERAGHLELIGAGRDRSVNAAKKKKEEGKKAATGGSKKFG
jgi:hypothetical protein